MYIKRWIPFILAIALLLVCGCSGMNGNGSAGGSSGVDETGQADAEEGSSDSAEVEEGLFRIALIEEVDTMDIHKTSSAYMVPINVFERLFEIKTNDDDTTKLVPALAESYTLSTDGRTYTFTLRADAFFSDGTPVRSSDVAFTFTRMLSLPESCQSDFADMILGAAAVMGHETDTLKGIKILDDRHFQITLTEPFSGYVYQLATPSCSILCEKCVREAGDAYGTSPETTIGSGPYMVTEYTRNGIILEHNPYYRDKPPVSRVEMVNAEPAIMDKMFREGGLDLLDLENIDSETIRTVYMSDEWKDRMVSKGCVETNYLMLNLDAHPLDDVRVRKAVQMAIDRQAILDELYDGEGTLVDGIFPRGLIGFSEENQGWLQYDPEGARKLLQEAGVKQNNRVELAVNSTDPVRTLNMMNMIMSNLQEVGLTASVVSYDSESRMYLRTAGKLMAYAGVWSADYNDPDNFIYTFFGSREKTRSRSGNFADKKVMERIAGARTIQDEKKRLEEYAELEKILIQDEAVWVPLFSTNHLYVMGERVEKFVPYWAGWNAMPIKDVVLK